MNAIRHPLHRHRCWAAALVVVALFIAMLVPAGYMPVMADGALLMRPCSGWNGPVVADAAVSVGHGDHDLGDHDLHTQDSPDRSHDGLEMPCAFSSPSAAVAMRIDPILLAIAIAAILAGTFPLAPKLVRARDLYRLPPSQGPPFA